MLSENEVILYKLRPHELPKHPNKLWIGKVIRCYTKDCILVESLESGYEGIREIILVAQIEKGDYHNAAIC